MGEADDIGLQGQVNSLGHAGVEADQGCKVQRVTSQTETWSWVKFSSTQRASSSSWISFFWRCKFCLRNVEGLGQSISTLSA